MEIGGDCGAIGLEYLDQQSVGSSGYGVGGGRLASDARDRNTLGAQVFDEGFQFVGGEVADRRAGR